MEWVDLHPALTFNKDKDPTQDWRMSDVVEEK